ncbi:MAG: GMC family oxidoreductase [Xanthobacteraceae bacterium]
MSEAQSYDYIIVGAGSAGCVLANRLTEDPNVTVCLLEAGPRDKSPLIHIPAGFIRMLFHPTYNYMFMSPADPNMKGRQTFVPRGRTLGGSSSINGMIYIRGHRRDFDEWAEMGNSGWGFNDLLPYFRKSENNENYDNPAHARGGPLNVKYLDKPNPLNHVFLDAADSLQKRRIPDFNAGDNEGFGIYQVTIKNGRRHSVANAFVHPVEGRKNLRVVTDAQVARVVIESGRATGVELTANGVPMRVDARNEVIVSAGAIQSPQVLMLSGIGNPEELKKHGIDVKHALRGVGQNLQEHISAPVHFMSPLSTSYGISLAAMPKIIWNALLYATMRKGFFGNNIVESGGFWRSQPGLDRPDIQQIFVPTHQGKPGQLLAWGHGFRVTSVLVRPKSKGRIGLASNKVGDPPVIDFRFFSDPGGEDMKALIRGVKDARRILMSPAFDKYRGAAVWPPETVQTDEEIENFIREFSSTVFHPVGTCKMGKDDMAVVDDRLRVRGTAGLRVVDASIMPTVTTGNTNAPTIAIAEKGADMIKADRNAAGRIAA